MKRLFALMVALAMLLCCATALADAIPAGEAPEADALAAPLTIYSETDIDRDVLVVDLAALGKDEAFLLKADTVAAVLTEAAERLTIADDGFQWDLILNGKDILTVAGEFTEEGFTLGSNLIPNHVFSFSNEELTSMAKANASKYEEQAKALERIDPDALARAVTPHFDNFIAAATAAFKAGEPEQGDYVMDGVSYNTMVPTDVDVAAISAALTQLEKDLLADPTVAVTIAQFDRSGKYTKAVEKAIDPAKAPAVRLETYTTIDDQGNQTGPVDTTFTVTKPGQKDPAAMGDVQADGEDVTAVIQLLDAGANLNLESRKTETGSACKADLYVKGLYFSLAVETGNRDGEEYNDADIYFLDPQNKLIGQRTTLAHEGQRTYDLSQGTPVTLAQLKSKDRDVMTGLSADAMIGLASISTAASEALPEEVSAMLALLSLSQKS